VATQSEAEFLSHAWRIACHAQSIAAFVNEVSTAAQQAFGRHSLAIRRIDLDHSRLITLAESSGDGQGSATEPRSVCSHAEMHSILGWCATAETRGTLRPAAEPLSRRASGITRQGPVVIAPLRDDSRAIGVLVVHGFEAAGLADFGRLAQTLIVPASAALELHLRFQEMTRLRESLEEDKRALLSRLERDDIAEEVIGYDAGLSEVMSRAARVASTDAPVLLLGETGTGKEVVARAIHKRSPRATGPFLRVNCGALAPGLIDSELFGHERGSFTGAAEARRGIFERADGGTLLLDEVGELSLDAQVRLLRVLQDGSFERVGGQKSLTSDVRVIAATHRDLRDMISRGTFRADLWYRLAVFPISIPPLRERPADIVALAAHFAFRSGTRLGGLPLTITDRDAKLLLEYPWPGNARELAAVIERAAILGDGHRLELAAALGSQLGVATTQLPARPVSQGAPIASLDQAMAAHIENALAMTGGRIEGPRGAAALLKINPHTLRARARKLGLDWRRFRAPDRETQGQSS
jgi:hydrogenase-4 transcriptional activator